MAVQPILVLWFQLHSGREVWREELERSSGNRSRMSIWHRRVFIYGSSQKVESKHQWLKTETSNKHTSKIGMTHRLGKIG